MSLIKRLKKVKQLLVTNAIVGYGRRWDQDEAVSEQQTVVIYIFILQASCQLAACLENDKVLIKVLVLLLERAIIHSLHQSAAAQLAVTQ